MFWRHLFRPLDATSIILIAVFATGLELGMHGGLFGLVILALMMSWFFKYAYVLLDAVSNGVAETPVLSVEMLNPVDEQRPLAQLFITCGIAGAAIWAGGWAGVVIGIVGLLYLPVSVAVLGASARALDAVNPIALTRTIAGLGIYYVLILGVIAVYSVVLVLLVKWNAWEWLRIALALFLVLSLFSTLGGALYERRHELGMEPTHTPEREAEARERERAQVRARALDGVYGEARGGNFIAARDSMLSWLRDCGPDQMERDARFFFSEARHWQDDRAFVFLARFLISQLLEAGKTGTAVEIVDGVLQRAPALKLGTAADALKIATLARAAGRRALALRVLAQFEAQFPGDARTAEVLSLRAELQR